MAGEGPNEGRARRRDERLIDLFLRGYRDRNGNSYRLAERPDRVERGRPAIDCIAVNERGDALAIEHTLVEPFEGQRADDQPFLAVFNRLHHSQELAVPNLLIDIFVPVGAIPRGVNWNDTGERVSAWFRETRLRIPVGESDHNIPGLGFDLTLHVDTMEIPETPGGVVIGRLRPRDRPFSEVLRRALAAKLPKLVAAPANSRILLVEDASMILGITVFAREIDAVWDGFPELARVDSVWLARTAVWENNVVWFFHVWPNGARERFRIEDA
jgi:hypothetical protein